jgi:REP element-mobilizing transposase RayT
LGIHRRDLQEQWGWAVFAVGGIGDHIHILFRLPLSLSFSEGGDAYQVQFVKMDEGD